MLITLLKALVILFFCTVVIALLIAGGIYDYLTDMYRRFTTDKNRNGSEASDEPESDEHERGIW